MRHLVAADTGGTFTDSAVHDTRDGTRRVIHALIQRRGGRTAARRGRGRQNLGRTTAGG